MSHTIVTGKQETGVSPTVGCFCKSTNKDNFLKKFYEWYDDKPEPTEDNESISPSK